jgi:hypothetical protein
MVDRAPTYSEQEAWRRADHDQFRRIGQQLNEVLPRESWSGFDEAERRERVERAAELLRGDLGVMRPAPLVWVDDPLNAGAGYDEHSQDGDIDYPEHHLGEAEPEHLVRGLAEEVRHAWQDDVRRGLTEHPLGEAGRRAIEHGFATYDENDPRTDSTNLLELDAKERAEWCVDGYLGNPPEFE